MRFSHQSSLLQWLAVFVPLSFQLQYLLYIIWCAFFQFWEYLFAPNQIQCWHQPPFLLLPVVEKVHKFSEFVRFFITDLDLENVYGFKVYCEASQVLMLRHLLFKMVKVWLNRFIQMFLILLIQIQLQSNKVSIVEHMLVSLLGYDQLYLLVQSVGNLIEIG